MKVFTSRKLIQWTGILFFVLVLGTPNLMEAEAKTLMIGASVFPEKLSTGISSYASLSLIYQMVDPLVMRDDNMKLIPGLATRWEALNPTTWRFYLREGVKFHDGEEFTAEDVKFTLDYVLNPKTVYARKRRITQIKETKIVDKYTVDIITKKPFPTLALGLTDVPIEPKHYHAAVGVAGMTKKPVGTGPFKLAKWVPGDRLELSANKDYWAGAPKVDKVVIRQIPEGSTRTASLLAGETHIIEEVPVDLLPEIKSNDLTQVASVESTVGLCLTMDTRKKPYDNPKVRLAMDYAINKPLILKQILRDQGSLLGGQVLTSNAFGHNPNLKPRPYDPEKAKQLLKEAGYPDGFTTSITTRSGKYLSDVDICNAVVGMLSQVGIKATVKVVEGGVYSKMVKKRDMGPIHVVGWYSLGDGDYSTVWFTQGGGRAFWESKEYDKLFIDARSTVDRAAREKAYWRMMEILQEENPAVFLFGLPSIYAMNRNLTGWNPRGDKCLRLNTAEVK